MFVANARPNARLQVLSWEPNPLTAALLRRSLVLNCWHHIDNERVLKKLNPTKTPILTWAYFDDYFPHGSVPPNTACDAVRLVSILAAC